MWARLTQLNVPSPCAVSIITFEVWGKLITFDSVNLGLKWEANNIFLKRKWENAHKALYTILLYNGPLADVNCNHYFNIRIYIALCFRIWEYFHGNLYIFDHNIGITMPYYQYARNICEHLKTKVIHFVFFKIYILFNYNFYIWAWISDESIVEECLQWQKWMLKIL